MFGSLLLGPRVGHTDYESCRIWIRIPSVRALRSREGRYLLRIHGAGVFPFKFTEAPPVELGTAVAIATGLSADTEYSYEVLLDRAALSGAGGRFRTMPDPGSFADISFVSISCSHRSDPGAWPLLADFIARQKPRFLVMMGDQVYLDEDSDVWRRNLATPVGRRLRLADVYQQHWNHDPVRHIMANIPTYMMWDDHDVRNGWGSFAPDSPTLAARYPQAESIHAKYSAYFGDARYVYWHFQVCSGPWPYGKLEELPAPMERVGLPFAFQCGRLLVIVADDRGARDIWREGNPVLGDEQWDYLTKVVDSIGFDVDAVAVVVPLPLASMSPTGLGQLVMGNREDDIPLLQNRQEQQLLDLLDGIDTEREDGPLDIIGKIGTGEISLLTDARDNWANHYSTPEQQRLLRLGARARVVNRPSSQPRGVVFIGGDLHCGGIFDIGFANPPITLPLLMTSGIAKQTSKGSAIVGIMVDENFDIADDIHATLRQFTHIYNFGVTLVQPTGETALISNSLVYGSGNSYWIVRVGPRELPAVPTPSA